MRKRYLHHLIALLAVLTTSLSAMAQDVLVNVTPKNPILPPQLLLYVSDPSQFFTVQLINTTSEEQRVYLSLGIEHIFPNDGLYACTPDEYQPTTPFVVPANGVYSLTLTDMKGLYNHIPASAMKIPDGLIDGYTNGSFGLLPEGTYSVQFSAWRWTGNNKDVPYCVSGANSGKAEFRVCYQASAPMWMLPMPIIGPEEFDVCEIDMNSPVFGWTAPTQACDRLVNYSYTLRFVEVLPFQTPDVAMDVNPVIFQTELITGGKTNYIIPVNRRELFKEDKTYAVQVTAQQVAGNKFDYVMMANGGKSPLRLFRVKEGDADKVWDIDFSMNGDREAANSYIFRNPNILQPSFIEGEVRKKLIDLDIEVEWADCWFESGFTSNPGDIDFTYTVQLYNGQSEADTAKTMTQDHLIYEAENIVGRSHTIPWADIESKVSVKDYLVLRVVPKYEGERKVIFKNDSLNVRDFTLIDRISPDYFSCTDQVDIDNKKPTTKKAADYKGKEIGIGQYQLVIDEIEGSGEKGFTGKGRVRWDVGIGTLMVHVKYKDLKINTDDIAYEGDCETYDNPSKPTNLDAVNSIFSDLGLEDLMANTSIPYADKITEGTKKLASEKIDGIADYYSLVKGGKAIWDMLVNGAETDVYLPLCLPKENKALKSLNSSPVDIQVTQMKFSPASATMNLIGEFTMPDSKCLASDMLVFGAPRLCISPGNILPEAGTLALLDNFTVKDPSSGYDCKFKAPTDLLEPSDGCYLAWRDYKFEILGIDMDMSIPKLKKVDEKTGEATEELPNLHIQASIASWDDFLVDDITMDPFEVASIPGFTFKADKITFDHSLVRNSTNMSTFSWSEDYKKDEAIGKEEFAKYGINGWQGFYMSELSVEFPKGLTGDDEKRLSISVKDMLVDPSGVTLDAGMESLLKASAGGFTFEINRIGLKIIQNNFDNCYLDGSIALPLIKNTDDKPAIVGVNCQIRKQLDEKGKKQEDYAYIFNTKSLNGDYKLDLFVAKLFLEQKLTYFLLEAEPELKGLHQGEMKTRVELLLGGRMEIGGKDAVEGWAKDKFGYDLSVPDVHFVGMRLANCMPWKSKYVDLQADISKERAEQQKNALAGLYLEGKEIHNGRDEGDGSDCSFYFHTGSWSLASMSKKLGPFEFTLEDYELEKSFTGSTLDVGLVLTGKVALVKGIDISASAKIALKGKITGISISSLSDIGCDFDRPELRGIGVHTSFCGFSLDGKLEFQSDADSPTGKGFHGDIDVKLPGDLFGVHGDGGFYEFVDKKDASGSYSWGWLHLAVTGNIVLGPCSITKLGGGFYMNSRRNPKGDDQIAINEKGLVGVYMELGMATPDKATLTGDLTLNVVYNRKRKCMSNFTMTGDVKAAGGLIDTKMTLVYENSPSDRYLQINITADLSISSESMVNALDQFSGELGTVKEMLDKLAGESFEVLTDCKAGLSSKIGAHADELGGEEEDPQKVANESKTSKKDGLPKMGAKISLDVKVTWRRDDVDYTSHPKWHVYLGEPDEKKRCTLTLIDFDGGIVACHVGANAYLCLGNELPNGGELPPIPEKIANFLDGSSKGDLKSDNISEANNARSKSLDMFKNNISGGVMLGAQGYGDFSLNLGLLSGKAETIFGFDVSLVHYNNAYCVNLKKAPGWNHWYARGQLYAYLYFQLALHFDLKFVHYDFDLASAEVGGVLKVGAPSPTYFEGKARAKVSLLGGLFKLDKTFTFDCGEVCQMFKGNALDDFKLFDQCSLGDTIRANGWYVESKDKKDVVTNILPKVNKDKMSNQFFTTTAPLGEHFRILDENELERILLQFDNVGGDISEGSDLYERTKMQANRTFIFKDQPYAVLFEYDSPGRYNAKDVSNTLPIDSKYLSFEQQLAALDDKKGALSNGTHIPILYDGNNSRHYLDMTVLRKALKAGRFYRLAVAGWAKELQRGKEVDPYTIIPEIEYEGNRPWVQVTDYFFQTEPQSDIIDKAPLQDYVALAYPSDYNRLRSSESNIDTQTGLVKYTKAYLSDVQCPSIALTQDIRDKAYRNGTLVWRLLTPMGAQVDCVENIYVDENTGSYVSKEGGVKQTQGVGNYKILNMEPMRALKAVAAQKYILTLDYYTKQNLNLKALQNETPDTTLVYLYVETVNSNWTKGVNGRNLEYETPFVAQKVSRVSTSKPSYTTDNTAMAPRLFSQDAMTYVGLMSNYIFPAGWTLTEKSTITGVTTSESLIYKDLNGGGKYEGRFDDKSNTNTSGSYDDIKNLIFYENNYGSDVKYPLSGFWRNRGDWDYVHETNDRIFPFNPSTDANNFTQQMCDSLSRVFDKISDMSRAIDAQASALESYIARNEDPDWWQAITYGTYLCEDGNKYTTVPSNMAFNIPSYQFVTVWKLTYKYDKLSDVYQGMDNSSSRYNDRLPAWNRLHVLFDKEKAKEKITQFDVTAYRVNAYDYLNGHYLATDKVMNGMSEFHFQVHDPLTPNKKTDALSIGVPYETKISSPSHAAWVDGQTNQDGTKSVGHFLVGADENSGSGIEYNTSFKTLDDAVLRVRQLSDSIRVIFDDANAYWAIYQSCQKDIEKPAELAVVKAKEAVSKFADGADLSSTAIKSCVEKVDRNYTEVYRLYNLMKSCESHVSANESISRHSSNDNRIHTYPALKSLVDELNSIMNTTIEPISNAASQQYKTLKLLQEESNNSNSLMKKWKEVVTQAISGEWVDEYGDVIKGGGLMCSEKAAWAKEHLNVMTEANRNKVDELYAMAKQEGDDVSYNKSRVVELVDQLETYSSNLVKNATYFDEHKLNAYLKSHASLSAAQNAVELIQKAIDDRVDHIDAHQEEIKEYICQTPAHVNAIKGADGNGGYMKQIRDLFNELCWQYVQCKGTILPHIDIKHNLMLEAQKKADALYGQLLPVDTLRHLLKIANRYVDIREGRDVDSADRWVAVMDSLIKASWDMAAPYRLKDVRNRIAITENQLYESLVMEDKAYHTGDLPKLEQCAEHCQSFLDNLAPLAEIAAQLDSVRQFVGKMSNPVWEGLKKAGFTESQDFYKEAYARWMQESAQNSLASWSVEVNNNNKEMADLRGGVEDILKEAMAYMADPSPLYPLAAKFFYAKLQAVEATVSSVVSSQEPTLKTKMTDALKQNYDGYLAHYEKALVYWNEYYQTTVYQGELELGFAYFKSLIENCQSSITEATKYTEASDSLCVLIANLSAAYNDSLMVSQYYYNNIPESEGSYRTMGKTVLGRVESDCKYVIDLNAELQRYMADVVMVHDHANREPLENKVQIAHDYLMETGEPYYDPADKADYIYNYVKAVYAKVDQTEKQLALRFVMGSTRNANSLASKLTNLNSQYEKMLVAAQELKTLKQAVANNQSNNVEEVDAKRQIVYELCDDVKTKAQSLYRYFDYDKFATEYESYAEMASYLDDYLSYVIENASAGSEAKMQMSQVVSDFKSDCNTIASKLPALKTRSDDALEKYDQAVYQRAYADLKFISNNNNQLNFDTSQIDADIDRSLIQEGLNDRIVDANLNQGLTLGGVLQGTGTTSGILGSIGETTPTLGSNLSNNLTNVGTSLPVNTSLNSVSTPKVTTGNINIQGVTNTGTRITNITKR